MIADTTAYEKYMKQLPVIPEVATKIMGIAEDGDEISFKELENVIKIDPGLTTKILRVANSAMYARQREIKNLQMAITLLGLKNIKSLVLLVTASNLFGRDKKKDFYTRFWKHSIVTAFLAKHIALRSNQKDLADEAFLAGLLHDIGQAAFYNTVGSEYDPILSTAVLRPREELEKERFGVDHKELGGALLAKWYFPEMYVDVAEEHDSPNITSKYKNLIITVTAADLITEILGFGFGTNDPEGRLPSFLAHLEINDADIEYYRSGYVKDLSADSLFQECQTLFGISS